MFKLSIQFATLVELTAFVNKMGGDVMGGTITHDQTIAADTTPAPAAQTPAQKAAATKAAKKAAAAQEAPAAPTAPVLPFPGGHAGPTSFAPGHTPAQPAAPAVPQAPATSVNAGPVHAPMAPAPSAPAMPAAPAAPIAPVVEVSPERKQWNDACLGLVNHLQTHGPSKNLSEQQMAQVLANAFAKAGCPMGSRISTISDQQIQAFYPVLHAEISAVLA